MMVIYDDMHVCCVCATANCAQTRMHGNREYVGECVYEFTSMFPERMCA